MKRVSGVPNRRQQKFILTKLIPAILREGGLTFAMETWRTSRGEASGDFSCPEEGLFTIDMLDREFPSTCNSVQCIGGTIESLCYTNPFKQSTTLRQKIRDKKLAAKIGLTHDEAYGLFYHWSTDTEHLDFSWPQDFAQSYYDASTPLEKAQIVASLLTKIATEGGACLHKESRQ